MSLAESDRKFEGYQDELEQLRRRARLSVTVNECLEIRDRVQDILEDEDFYDTRGISDKVIIYRAAMEVYRPLVDSLATFGKEAEGMRKSLGRLVGKG